MALRTVPVGTEPLVSGVVMITGRYRLLSDVVSELKHALAADPGVVVLDLHDASDNLRLLSGILGPVADYLSAWPGTGVAVCLSDPVASASELPPVLAGRVVLAGSPAEGLDRVRHLVPPQERTTTFLNPEPRSSEEARSFTRGTLRGWRLEGLLGSASLVVSELVTHSILEAQTALDLTLGRIADRVRIAVHDFGADKFRVPGPRRAPDPLKDTSQDCGLLLVDELTRCWGVFPSRIHGKTVWAVLQDA